jgi:predicted nucleic acid-binding protein
MRRVFVDTSGFVGLLVPQDALHARARSLFEQADAERWQLVTTNAVIVETYSLLLVRTRDRRSSAIAFLDSLDRTGLAVERIRQEDEERAVALVRAHRDKTYSLCDALSFVIMERLGITEAIAFDRHFREYGQLTIL